MKYVKHCCHHTEETAMRSRTSSVFAQSSWSKTNERTCKRANEQKMMKTFLRAYTLTIGGKIFWLISFYSHHHHHSTWSAYVNWHFFIKRNAERPSWWECRGDIHSERVEQKANKKWISAPSHRTKIQTQTRRKKISHPHRHRMNYANASCLRSSST